MNLGSARSEYAGFMTLATFTPIVCWADPVVICCRRNSLDVFQNSFNGIHYREQIRFILIRHILLHVKFLSGKMALGTFRMRFLSSVRTFVLDPFSRNTSVQRC